MADKKQSRVSTDFIVDEKGVATDVRSKSALSVKVDVDVSSALKGLKAVQREAKEATKAIKELESLQSGKLATLHEGEVIITKNDSGSFYIAKPRSLWTQSESFGTWDILKDKDGLVSFPSVRDAKEFAEKPYAHNGKPDENYYIVEIKG